MGFLGIHKDADEPGAAWPAIMVGMFAAFAGILYGYDTGTISGIQEMNFWLNEMGHPDSNQLSLIVSILSVGTFFGALCAGFISDKLGRKWGIIVCAALPFNLGVALQVAATTQSLFIAGRFFAGLGVGLVSVQVPMYQSETLPKWIRGFVVGAYQLCITLGLLIASLINYGTQNMNNSGSYRIPLAIQFAWSIILCVGMFTLPETPRWLVTKNRNTEAAKSLSRLRRLPLDHPAIVAELEEFKASWEYQLSLGKASWAECFKGTVGKRTFTGITLQALQQLVGINFIFYYGTTYFSSSGSGTTGLPGAFILQVTTNVVNVVTTFPGLYAIDRFGRRPVLLVGALGMGISQYIVAACGIATPLTNQASAATQFAFICIYIAFFASTFGPGAWVVTGEIFPLKVRAKCLSLTTAANWLMNWLISFIIPYMIGTDYADLGSNVFWIWGGFCWISVVFVFFMIYETKGLSLEQVSELYEVCGQAWKSDAARDRLSRSAGDVIEKERKIKADEAFAEAEERREKTGTSGRKLETIEG